MIERQFIKQKLKEHQIQEFIASSLKGASHSHTKIQRTPLGDKIVIHAARPGLVVGRKGENIKNLTETLKKRFGLENPQVEIAEVENPNLDAQIIAERIVSGLERFGASKFKSIGHRAMTDVITAGAIGVEILIGGRGVPSSRSKSWRFYQGYLKKCGDVAISQVLKAKIFANLKTGTVGIKVKIMPPDIQLPDKVLLKEMVTEEGPTEEEVKEGPEEEEKTEEKKEEKAEKKEEKPKPKKKAVKKKKPEEKK